MMRYTADELLDYIDSEGGIYSALRKGISAADVPEELVSRWIELQIAFSKCEIAWEAFEMKAEGL